ncbi:hypothetical protein [Methanobrevibacter sp. DSM 116169]|uniref:hypothetical protein n=1 Tax=Methanobrevibacter sp. DSM 116169 TaxID=3242727 RepID=UPI0038FCE847
MSDLYKYIHYNPKKKLYEIRKDGKYYDSFSLLTDALYERDCLVNADWDYDVLVDTPHYYNHYPNMDLPPFSKENDMQNIYWDKNKWCIRKWINGKRLRFGRFKSLDEAKSHRDWLKKNGWRRI